ncbi:MAG: CAP domain-containing protein [Eubacteriales bacterium]|nr:CAP domain-containing protein [Eubacteriales bacterium]
MIWQNKATVRRANKETSIRPVTTLAFTVFLVALLAFLGATPVAASSRYLDVQGNANHNVSLVLLNLANEARSSAGLSTLSYDYGLQNEVEQRAAEISIYFEHAKPDGRSPFANCQVAYMGENIQVTPIQGSAQDQAQAIFDAFKASPTHWSNIMDPSWTVMAAGVWHAGSFDKDGESWPLAHVAQWFSDTPTGLSQSAGAGSAKRQVFVSNLPNISFNVEESRIVARLSGNTYGAMDGWSYSLTVANSSFSFISDNPAVVAIGQDGALIAQGDGSARIQVLDSLGQAIAYLDVTAQNGLVN